MKLANKLAVLAVSSLVLASIAVAQPRSGSQARPAEAGRAEARDPDAPIRVVTYNVEHWRQNFLAHKVWPTSQPSWPADLVDLVGRERREDDEENWEVARVLLHPDVRPDILVVQEGPEQRDLNYFNTQFLRGYFETLHVFPTNTGRGQQVAMLLRPGFRVREYRQDFHMEPDPRDENPTADRLFARGPAFAKVRAPSGREFWVGTNHAKSKAGNSPAATRWRNAEARRTREIIAQLRREGPAELIFLGDLNDEVGIQAFEQEAGGSAIDLLVGGTGPDALTLLTRELSDRGAISYHGGRRGRYRSFIDHAVATPELADAVRAVRVFTGDVADVASDHYPVVVEIAP